MKQLTPVSPQHVPRITVAALLYEGLGPSDKVNYLSPEAWIHFQGLIVALVAPPTF